MLAPRAIAQQLGLAIKESSEYKAFTAAKARVEEHEAARIMLADFRQREGKYRQALLAGQAQEAETKELKELAEIVGYNPYIRELFAAEARLTEMLVGLQQEMMSAAGLAGSDLTEEGENIGQDS